MQYIAMLDYYHLDHSFFMKSFAEAMALQKGCSGIILHGDSAYTDRLVQTGMMREDAVIRSTRELNHRIIALLADNGISGIGVNGYQREILRTEQNKLLIDSSWLNNRPSGTHVVLSNLVWNSDRKVIDIIPLRIVAEKLRESLKRNYIIVFPKSEADKYRFQQKSKLDFNGTGDSGISIADVPDDLKPLPEKCFICTATAFGKLPDTCDLQIISG